MLRNYLKIAVKVLLRRKLFTAISLFGITFTLIVLVILAALADHALGPVGPELRQDRILVADADLRDGEAGSRQRFGLGYQLSTRFFRELPGAERTSIFLEPRRARSYRDGVRIDFGLKLTDADFWKILSFDFVEGGPYAEEDLRQARPVAVISETTRQKLFDGAPAMGRALELDGQRFRVVGVVSDVSRLREIPWADVWVPVTTSSTGAHLSEVTREGASNWTKRSLAAGGPAQAIVLARSRADFSRIKHELSARVARWDSPDPRKYRRATASLETRFERMVGDVDQSLFGRNNGDIHIIKLGRVWAVAVGLSLLFMLVPAVNLVNLNLGRILERASEIGVRKSFGASSRTLVAQFIVENVVLTVIGGVLALLLSTIVLGAVSASGRLGATPLSVSPRVFLAGLGLALLFGLVSGVYPAWKMARMQPLAALRGGVR